MFTATPRSCTCGGTVVSAVVDQHPVEEDASKVPREGLLPGEAGGEGEGISREAGVCQDCRGRRKKTTTEVSKERRGNGLGGVGWQEDATVFFLFFK